MPKEINKMKLMNKRNYQRCVINCLDSLYARGLTQAEIAIAIGVTDRAIRKWERLESVPGGVQYINLKRLCKELGA